MNRMIESIYGRLDLVSKSDLKKLDRALDELSAVLYGLPLEEKETVDLASTQTDIAGGHATGRNDGSQ